MLKAGGTVEEYEAKAGSIKASLHQELQCFLPACVLTVTVTAGSVILTVVATDASGGASQVGWAAVALQTKSLDAMSSVLGITIEEPPATPIVIEVQVQVTPPPPSPLPRSPPLPHPPSPPMLPPPSPTATLEDKANSRGLPWVPLWAPLSMLLVVTIVLLVLCYLRHSRMSRNEANLRISRDRANSDLQMLSHQVQVRMQVQPDDSASLGSEFASLPDSLHAKRRSTTSLPPGPPSSSTGQSVGPDGGDADGADLVQNTETCSSLPSLSPGAPSGTASVPSTALPPLTWAEADKQWLVAQGATNVEGLVLAGSSRSSTGFEGVYASGGGFRAELQKGGKRLRQDGFRSPVEAALARARWTKSLEEGKEHAPSATARASSAEQELLAAEALADLAMAEGATVAQPSVSTTGVANTKHKEGRWLAPLRNLVGFFEGVYTNEGGSDAKLQKGAKHLRQIGASSPRQATLERAGHTEEDRGTTVTIASSSVTSEVTVPHQHGVADGCSTCSTVEQTLSMQVIRNYTPRAPGELPMRRWVSCAQMLRQLQPHARAEDHVERLITDHFKDHPAFAGHPFHAWCKKLKDYDAPAGAERRTVMKFSLDYTPTGG